MSDEYTYQLINITDKYYNTDDGLIIAEDYYKKDKSVGKRYKLYKIDNMKYLERDNHLYEIILEKEGYCYKMYYDIDLFIDKDKIDEYNNKLNELKTILSTSYKSTLNIDFKSKDIIVLDASRDSKDGKYKLSKHFILPVYVEKPENLYVLFTYMNTILNNLIDVEIYSAFDKEVYVKNANKSHQLRLYTQTKLGKPESLLKCDNPDVKIIDTLITQYKTDDKIIFNTEKINSKLIKIADKMKYPVYNLHHTLDGDDMKSGNMNYNFKDMINLDFKEPNEKIDITNMDIIEYYRKEGFSIKSDIKLYMKSIPNTPDNKQSFRVWWNIGCIAKKNDVDYKIFEEWTLKAYTNNLNDVAKKCRARWNMMKDTKYGLLHLINIAKIYCPNIYLKKSFANRFIKLYYYDKKEWVNIDKKDDEVGYMNKYYKMGYSGIITDENVGGGKTNEVINFTKNNENTFTIIFSNRILFAVEIANRFKKELGDDAVVCYDDNRKKTISLIDKSVLIISFESLTKWKDEINKRIKGSKLVCVYDEMETLQRNIVGKTIKNTCETIDYLCNLWKHSAFNIILDAYMTKNTYDYVNKLNNLYSKKNKMIYMNTYNMNKYPKTFNIKYVAKSPKQREKMMEIYTADMKNVLENPDNKIVIFCEVFSSVQEIYHFLINTLKIPEKEILKHTGKDKINMTDEEIERAKSYLIDKEKMKSIRVWIYTSSILNGVSIENVKFSKCYGIITKYSKQEQSAVGIYGNDFLNAIARARLNDEWFIFMEEKESTSYTFRKYKDIKKADDTIDNKILRKIRNEVDSKTNESICIDRIEDGEDKDEFKVKLQLEISNLNGYIQNPIKYRKDVEIGYRGIEYFCIYEKNEDVNKEHQLVYKVESDKYLLWKEKGYIVLCAYSAEMINLVMFNSNYLEEMNGIFKLDVLECLALIKNNKVVWDITENDYKDISVCGRKKAVVVKNWDNTDLYNIYNIHTIVDVYYGVGAENREKIIKLILGDYNMKRNIDNWISIIQNKANETFNPVYVIEMITKSFNITKLKELPDEIRPEQIEELDYYGKTKDTINNFKRSIGRKITDDPVKKRNTIYMKFLNEILKPTGYYYKVISKCRVPIKYELEKPKTDIIVNDECYKIPCIFWEAIWDRVDIINNNQSFIEEYE